MRVYKTFTVVLALSAFVVRPSLAAGLSCRAPGGQSFAVDRATAVTRADIVQPGSLKCDVVYLADGEIYILGGCNRAYVGLRAEVPGVPIGHKHGRMQLQCK